MLLRNWCNEKRISVRYSNQISMEWWNTWKFPFITLRKMTFILDSMWQYFGIN